MKFWTQYRKTWALLRKSAPTIIAFELLYKLFVTLLCTPVFYWLLKVAIRAAGIPCITRDNLATFLSSPLAILILLLVLLCMAFMMLMDISAIIQCYHATRFGRRMTLFQMLEAGARDTVRIFQRHNWRLILFVALLVPLTSVAAVSGYVTNLSIPEYIMEWISKNSARVAALLIFLSSVTLLAFQWGLSIHVYTLENCNMKTAHRKSRTLIGGRYLSMLLGFLVWEGILYLITILLTGLFTLLAFDAIRFLCTPNIQYAVALRAAYAIVTVMISLLTIFNVPLAFAQLSCTYYSYKEIEQELLPRPETFRGLSGNPRLRRVLSLVICLIFLFNGVTYAQALTSDFDNLQQVFYKPAVVAHRGSSVEKPENSIPAFQQAMDDHADWIELDVHQTKDGVVVVTHDASLKRIAGVDLKIYDLTYSQLQEYDVGSWFSEDYAGLRVATLGQVLRLCKDKIKIQIELKPTGHEENFEQHVINIVKRHGFEEQCVLASMNAKCLKTIRSLDPELETLYIMSVAVGDIQSLSFADGFSIEGSFITQNLVDSIHEAGKPIAVWTVNKKDKVQKYVGLRVDAIVSDDPLMVQEAIGDYSLSQWVSRIVALFFSPQEPEATAESTEDIARLPQAQDASRPG